MSIINTNIKYQIEITIFNGEKVKDTQSLVAIRSPMLKTASFLMHSVNLRMRLFLSLQEYTDAGQFILVKYRILLSEDFTPGKVIPDELREICNKQFICFHMRPLERIDPQQPWVSTLLYLANPVLFFMNNSSGYNKILEDKTAIDCLKDFENYCKEKFGDGFEFEKIGEDKEKNNHKYKQILLRQKSDLIVPSYIINYLKTWHSFGYYFFDDFRFDNNKSSLKDITCWCVNLFDYEEFNKKNISEEFPDYILGMKEIDVQPITDTFGEIQSYDFPSSVITKGSHQEFGYRKTEEKRDVPKYSSSNSKNNSSDSRDVPYIESKFNVSKQKPSDVKNLYAPDDPLLAEYRYKITGEQIRDRIRALHTYYITNCHFDVFDFGHRYNLDIFSATDYLHVPISIINIFTRVTDNVPLLTHYMKLQTLRYYS